MFVATDHKLLLSILNDKALDTITNPRLLRLKERTLLWCLELIYLPGNKQTAADTLSRKKKVAVLASLSVHVSQEYVMERVLEENALAGLREMVVSDKENDLQDQPLEVMSVGRGPAVIKWSDLQKATEEDEVLTKLIEEIQRGIPDSSSEMLKEL